MQAVFRLLKDFIGVLFKHIGGDLLAPVCGQRMLHHTIGLGQRHAAQLYVSLPYYEESGIEKSAIQLIGYDKTAVLQPGASETVTVTEVNADYETCRIAWGRTVTREALYANGDGVTFYTRYAD